MDQNEQSSWDYKPDSAESSADSAVAPKAASPKNLSWTSVEYIDHRQGAGWYIMIMLLVGLIAAGLYFLTKDYFAVGATFVAGLLGVIYAQRKPRRLTYGLDSRGLSIGDKQYVYSTFKSFSVFREGGLSSLNLMPTKRFMPPITVYFDVELEQKITDIVGEHIPFEQHKLDAVDRLTRRLHL